ncbi:MAG TPA: 2-(1,2-epoxy-1,2-dihydrophenyl)acetyl-CoA isomerase PaaG [Nevskiaceae bacterium]|nr:2-(1,2-epoxy-1,2-dihydrophenyl)acetyl-CoA isomerase PaaG [Nevskiaceae bacterium]
MSESPILFSNAGGIARITLNRPDKLNSFNVAMHEALRDAIRKVAEDRSARVLLLTGAGRAFCAGQDLGDRAVAPGGEKVDLGASVESYYAPLVRGLRALPLPVVCAVNGVAAGAGANVVLACDLVIARRSAKFIEPFAKLGLIPDTGGTYFLPRRLGTARAMAVAMTAATLTADQAADWGLIWRCVDDDAFDGEVEALLKRLATAPTKGLARTKQLIYASASNTLDAQLVLEGQTMRELGFTHDYAEGVAAFMAKRAPTFKGN